MSKLLLTIIVTILVLASGWPPVESSGAGETALPTNGRIAFSAVVSGSEHIFTIDAQGGFRLQLTTEGSVNKFPSWSSDGATIVFSSDRTGTLELWRMRTDGRAQTQIPTELPGVKFVPQLSPDGTTIVFAYVDLTIGHPEVWSISANGGNARRLTTTPNATTGPTWSLLPHFSPDGRRIVYASTKSGSSQIWIMNADGTGQTQVTSGLGPEFPDANAPKWSPDGSRIAFWSGFETQFGEIWTMKPDGTDARQLTDQPGAISSDNPAWSPDGTKILFDTNRQSSPQIWMMNADGLDQHLLVDIGIGNTQFSWQPIPLQSPALNGLIVASDFELPDLTPGDIYAIRPDGTGKSYLTHGRVNGKANGSPAWSFDGTKVAYASNQGGSLDIWIMDANGGSPLQLTSSGGISPAFSPDGTSIVYNGLQFGTQREVWVMHSNGTNPTRLTTTTVSTTTRGGVTFRNSSLASYSPDGTKIVYASTQSGRIEIWVMNADGTNQTQLTFPGNTDAPDANAPAWSPDGTKIAFWSGYEAEGGSIWVMNPDGTGRTKLETGPNFVTGMNSDNPNWSPDGSIIFVSNRVTGNVQTWIINADGSNPRVLLSSGYGGGLKPWRNDPVATVSGRVTSPDGRGLRNAAVSITDSQNVIRIVTTSSFGFYAFDSVLTGAAYTIRVSSRRYRFSSMVIQVNDNLSNVDFVGLE